MLQLSQLELAEPTPCNQSLLPLLLLLLLLNLKLEVRKNNIHNNKNDSHHPHLWVC
jgi:hypothetical protein